MSENLDELGINGEFEEDGREIILDTSGEAELTDDATEGVAELRDTIAQQDSEAEQYAIDFLKKGRAHPRRADYPRRLPASGTAQTPHE